MDWTGGYVYPINSSMDTIDKEGLGINDLENRIEKLEEGLEKSNGKTKEKREEGFMGRIGELNKDTIWIVVDDPSKIVRLEDY